MQSVAVLKKNVITLHQPIFPPPTTITAWREHMRPTSAPTAREAKAAAQPETFSFAQVKEFDAHVNAIATRSEHVVAMARRRRTASAAPTRRGELPSRWHQPTFESRQRAAAPANFNCLLQRKTREDLAMGKAKDDGQMWGFKQTKAHVFRSENSDPARRPRGSADRFVLQLATKTRQQQKLEAAQSQGKMMEGRALRVCPCHDYDPTKDGKPAFVKTVPGTANKTASLQSRIDVARDQEKLWDGGLTVGQHSYRGTLRPEARRRSCSWVASNGATSFSVRLKATRPEVPADWTSD